MRGNQLRKATGFLAITTVAALALSACASTGPAADNSTAELSDEPVTLTFSWWGNDARNTITENVIEAFEKEHPNITIEPQPADWGSYWDKLATETAAGNAADVIQMDELYLAAYADRGALMDLGSFGDQINTSDFPESILELGEFNGELYGITGGLSANVMFVNPVLLENAGIAMPDDTTWTWDDFKSITDEVSKAGGGEVYGTQNWGTNDGNLRSWARQHGEALYNDKGEVSITPATLTSWWQYLLDLNESGASPSATATTESRTAGLSGSFIATNTVAFADGWSNQLIALAQASGSPLVPLRLPTIPDAKEGFAFYHPAEYWTISARTEHPAEAALFLDFLANSEVAADYMLTERGVPANTKLRDHIASKVSPEDRVIVDYIDSISDEVGETPKITPAGASSVIDVLSRYTDQVLYKTLTPEAAAAGFIEDLNAAIATS